MSFEIALWGCGLGGGYREAVEKCCGLSCLLLAAVKHELWPIGPPTRAPSFGKTVTTASWCCVFLVEGMEGSRILEPMSKMILFPWGPKLGVLE